MSHYVMELCEGNVNGGQSRTSEKVRCFHPSDTVDIAMGQSGIAAKKPVTIPEYYRSTFDKMSHKKALCWKDNKDGPWKSLTYGEYKKLVYNIAKSLLKLGLEPFHAVAVLGSNCIEPYSCCIGAIYAGGLSTGIYATSSPDGCYYVMENSRANIVIVDEQEQLHKILQVRSRLPKLKAIIQCKGELDKVYPDVFTWTKFLEVSKDMEDSVIDDIISKQQPNQCAMVVYSSGTTGTSKGIMLSHDNLTWASYAFCDMYDIGGKTCNEMRTVNYGSLAHIGPRNVNMLFPIPVGGTVYFAQPDAMEGSLVDTIKEVQPTVFYGQPRVWEEIRRKVEIDNYTTKEEFGFGKCQLMLTGGSSANPKTLAFFLAMDMPIRESYGTSENTGSAAVGTAARSGCGKKCLIGTEIKIGSPGNGEVLIRGRPVAMGYLGMEQKTREAIDDERWLHTGDIGRMDENGLLYITGRIKELVILQNGVNVAPNYIENHIKFEIPFLSNVVLAGEGKNYLTCLLTLKCVMDPDSGEATDNLLPQVIKMFEELGTNCTTVSQVINSKDKIVFKAIQDGIDYYNTQHSQTDLDKVKKWVLLDKDFTVASGELGPTLKLKRPTVLKKHARLIEGLYEEC